MALMAGNGVVLKPASLTPLLGERIRETFEKAGPARGAGAGRPRRRRDRPGAVRVLGAEDLLHRLGRGRSRGGRDLRQAAEGLGAGAGRQGPADRLRRRRPRQRDLGLRVGRLRERGPDLLGNRAHLRGARGRGPLHRGSRAAGRASSPSAIRWSGRPRSGRWSRRTSSTSSPSLVDDALEAGAERVAGGPREVPGFGGKFIAPTVLAGVEDEMRIMKEEIFGPVVPIIVVDSEEEALERANDSNFGLGASIWTKDRAKGERMARRIESGMVWINDHSYTHAACQCSWGGVKESGLGRSHSKFGFYECVDVKLVSWEPGLTRDFWWQPYDRTLGQAVRASARLLYGRNGQRLKALREGGLPLLRVGARTLRKDR